jgi:hypothetical protein
MEPLEFDVFQDGVESNDTPVVASFTVKKVRCDSGADEEALAVRVVQMPAAGDQMGSVRYTAVSGVRP